MRRPYPAAPNIESLRPLPLSACDRVSSHLSPALDALVSTLSALDGWHVQHGVDPANRKMRDVPLVFPTDRGAASRYRVGGRERDEVRASPTPPTTPPTTPLAAFFIAHAPMIACAP